MKWYFICMMVIMVAGFGAMGVEAWAKAQAPLQPSSICKKVCEKLVSDSVSVQDAYTDGKDGCLCRILPDL